MKSNFIQRLLPALALLAGTHAAAQEMTLAQCREAALDNNRRMEIAAVDRTRAELTVKAARANFLPRISASGMALYSTPATDLSLPLGSVRLFDPDAIAPLLPPEFAPLAGKLAVIDLPDLPLSLDPNNSYLVGVSIEQPIYMGGKVRSACRMARIGEQAAAVNMRLARAQVIAETDRAYWLLVQAIEMRRSAQSYKETVDEFLRVVGNAVDAGMRSRNDLLKVEVEKNQAALQLLRAENGVRLARMNLCQMLGMPLDSDITPAETFDDEIFLPEGGDVTARPEYELLTRQMELKDEEKRFIRSDFLPQVGVRGSYNYTYGLRLNDRVMLNNDGVSAVLSVKIPIFHWGEGARKVRAAEAERAKAALQRDEMTEKMTLEMQQAANACTEYALEVALTRAALEQAEENLTMSRNYYEAGMETVSDYLEAQTIRLNAETEHIVARANLEISRTEYMRAAGLLDGPAE